MYWFKNAAWVGCKFAHQKLHNPEMNWVFLTWMCSVSSFVSFSARNGIVALPSSKRRLGEIRVNKIQELLNNIEVIICIISVSFNVFQMDWDYMLYRQAMRANNLMVIWNKVRSKHQSLTRSAKAHERKRSLPSSHIKLHQTLVCIQAYS